MGIVQKQDYRYILLPNVLFAYCQNSMTPWEVKDIGIGGLSFEYNPIHGEVVESEIIDIVDSCYNKKNELSNIPCNVIFDYSVLSAGHCFRGEIMRRRGLKFDQLTEIQAISLELLLDSLWKSPASVQTIDRNFHTSVSCKEFHSL